MKKNETKSFQYNIPTKTRMKHGKISSENRDRTPFNMEKKEFEECINLYSNIGSIVSISIDTLRFFNNNDSVQLVGKYAPAFTSFLIDSIWRSSIVSLNAFFSNDERGFKKLFDYIKANHNKIFTGKFYDIIDYGDEKKEVKIDFNKKTIFELIKECQDKISDHETLLKKLNAFRDNSYAHFSKDKNGSLNDIDLSIDDLSVVLNLAESITNKLNIRYNRIQKTFKPINSTDIKNIGYILDMYDKNS